MTSGSRSGRKASGAGFFDSATAGRWNLVVIALAFASVASSFGAIELSFHQFEGSRVWAWAMSGFAVVGAIVVSYWSLYVDVAIARLLSPGLGPLPDDAIAPRKLLTLARVTWHGSRVAYKSMPLLWQSPLATTVRRLRLVSLIFVYVTIQVTVGTGTILRGSFTPAMYIADVVVLAVINCALTILLLDNTRRHMVISNDIVIDDDRRGPWIKRMPSLVIGVVFFVVSGVVLVDRIASVVNNPLFLAGGATTVVQLPASTQTIYVGCDGDLHCSTLTPSEIIVVDSTNHETVAIIPDVGIDHESFREHPWLSIASFRAPRRDRYLVTINSDPTGQYALSLSQVDFLHQIAPLVIETVLRLIGVGLGIVAFVEIAKQRRRGQFTRVKAT